MTGRRHWDAGQVIDRIKSDGFTPDVVFGMFGTSGGRFRDAFNHYGMKNVSVGFSEVFSAGWEKCWQTVQTSVNAGFPEPCLIDAGMHSGGNFQGHWAVVSNISGGQFPS